MKKTVHVVVGIVVNKNNEILIAKRPDNLHQGGLWEFPGGKVEQNESVFEALVREFREEVDIHIQTAEALTKIEHDYTDKSVLLDVWRSEEFDGLAKGIEGQEIKWVAPAELKQYQFPEANKPIVEALSVVVQTLST